MLLADPTLAPAATRGVVSTLADEASFLCDPAVEFVDLETGG